ncbi:hypothetical protein GLOIN_2v1548262 [Rhizophagus clarus]|uniref:Uncharacterized protein n=1 Tax=Rhizophagus clarus TaxID=94130 RepID=A0A8H3QLZ7_9GLOM|nr:hypothetical protein GLOIN_2v1548262 [Rhizophagus clarus]
MSNHIHSNCEHTVLCLKCNELFTLPAYQSGTLITYPGQNFMNYYYNNESYFINLVNLLSEHELTQTACSSPLSLSIPETSIMSQSFTPTTPVVDPNEHHIPAKIDKKLSFHLIFIEDIEDKRPIPKRDEIKKSVEKIFPKLKDKDWDFLKCESFKLVPANIPWTINDLKRISGFRKKLYVGYKKRL